MKKKKNKKKAGGFEFTNGILVTKNKKLIKFLDGVLKAKSAK